MKIDEINKLWDELYDLLYLAIDSGNLSIEKKDFIVIKSKQLDDRMFNLLRELGEDKND